MDREKNEVIELIRRLPGDVTTADIMEEFYFEVACGIVVNRSRWGYRSGSRRTFRLSRLTHSAGSHQSSRRSVEICQW